MGKIIAVCTSAEKGTQKRNVERAEFVADHGIKGDAHAGPWHRQVSLLSHNKIEDFRAKGAKITHARHRACSSDESNTACPQEKDSTVSIFSGGAEVIDGAFGENLVVDGIDFRSLPVGTILECNSVVLEMTQIGKECHSHCAIFKTMGDCIMPREGVFAKVVRGGFISVGDEMTVKENTSSRKRAFEYRVWIVTSSDKGARGEREDLSAPVIREIIKAAGYGDAGYTMLPDDQAGLEKELRRICDGGLADIIFTTGGTGFSPRDRTPEATAAVAERLAPGIAEAMRAKSMNITKRAMLSRAIAAIRGSTLIVNLPGSPKAVRENLEFIIPEMRHGLDILCGRDGDCARQ